MEKKSRAKFWLCISLILCLVSALGRVGGSDEFR